MTFTNINKVNLTLLHFEPQFVELNYKNYSATS